MRSRYTAFVVGDAGYLAATWHPGTRPDDLDLDPSLRWTGLEIVDVGAGGEGDTRGVVEFRAALARAAATPACWHERSRFVKPERTLVVPRRSRFVNAHPIAGPRSGIPRLAWKP